MKAVVLAAGEGKRLRPLTNTRPKVMIELAGRPVIEHLLRELKGAGIREAVLVVKYMKERVMNHLEYGRRLGMKISYVEQGEKYGTAAAFLTAEKEIGGEPFLGIAGDIVTEAAAIRKLIKGHSGRMTIGLKRVKEASQYGVATLHKGLVTGFEEKPARPKSSLANASMYVMEPSAFMDMRGLESSERGETEITDLIRMYAKSRQATGIEFADYWLDMGMPWHLFDANAFLISRMPAKKAGKIEDSTISGKVILEKGARVFKSHIEGPAYIGAGAMVGPHALIRGTSSIGRGSEIGESTTVKNSIVGNEVNAKHLAYIGDSIIGDHCNFGAGTQIANFKFDESTVKAEVGGQVYETMRTKMGAILGDNVKTGVLSSIMPGKSVGDHSWIGAGVVVSQNIPANVHVVLKQQLEIRPRG